eukprot:CAMPEP_0117471426 /NCGR_PEP_ID=MMETSP0784-20121206/7724_1 /TAXON_ID=39447 /ORGANISM="" /LENGTH=476 /DNA_ID=CAMNT_0005265543 /DNA_START=63 /DNA_END=1494 /DNA_ORIENTATION=-
MKPQGNMARRRRRRRAFPQSLALGSCVAVCVPSVAAISYPACYDNHEKAAQLALNFGWYVYGCSDLAAECNNPSAKQMMQTVCPQTCNLCDFWYSFYYEDGDDYGDGGGGGGNTDDGTHCTVPSDGDSNNVWLSYIDCLKTYCVDIATSVIVCDLLIQRYGCQADFNDVNPSWPRYNLTIAKLCPYSCGACDDNVHGTAAMDTPTAVVIRNSFAQYGNIETVYEKQSCDGSTRWAYILFETEAEATSAQQVAIHTFNVDGTELWGHPTEPGEVTACADVEYNIARDGSLTASSEQSGYAKEKAIDGATSGLGDSWMCASTEIMHCWLQITFPGHCNVKYVKYRAMPDRPRSFFGVWEFTDGTEQHTFSNTLDEQTVTFQKTHTTQYVKLTLAGFYDCQINGNCYHGVLEIEYWGSCPMKCEPLCVHDVIIEGGCSAIQAASNNPGLHTDEARSALSDGCKMNSACVTAVQEACANL